MTKKEEKEFLEKNFKAGDYYRISVLVQKDSLSKFLDFIKTAPLTLAVMPSVEMTSGFDDNSEKGTTQ